MAQTKSEKEIEQAIDNYITNKVKGWDKKSKKKKNNTSEGGGSMIYFVGFIGSLVYWMQAAVGFGAVVTGFLKALVWPAYVVYKLLENFYGVAI